MSHERTVEGVSAFLQTLSGLVHLPPCLASRVGVPLGRTISRRMLTMMSRSGLRSQSGLVRCVFDAPSQVGWCLLKSPSRRSSVLGDGRKVASC